MTSERPKGGRRAEDFPDAVARDRAVLNYLKGASHHWSSREASTRNVIAADLGESDPRKIAYSLHRLRRRGQVQHVSKGNEGHGFWALAEGASDE